METRAILLGLFGVAVLSVAPAARATLADLELLQAAHPNLLHLYKFEGIDDTTRLADSGPAGLNLVREGGADGGDVNDIMFVPGFDGISQAYQPSYQPGARRVGAGLITSGATTVPGTVTAEAVFQLDEFAPQAAGDVSYILSARPASGRAYFMMQTDTPANRVTTTFGDTFSDRPAVFDYVAGDWYYLAVVAQYDSMANQTTVDWYFANLSGGDPTLTHLVDSTTFQGDWTGSSVLGIGVFNNGTQEFLQGRIDNLALTGAALSEQDLQARLNALLIPEPSAFALVALAGGMLFVARRKRA
ncbi:MAG TPA: PEP-CTERM sorting domain-containing protein [Verrucomicrobia bacterium]|mgnify:CR=1 FL=1|nr:PEP-CTERM sorting domain-containing protein [Verrucomicrobiota bacterium]HOP97234.1 PEP-CTERM sorting domain-containing protein [Verrucomicrobiota bacterium]HPU55809.1 PEP-CTERM sorting domain-containing protein [Verrucomicrobiota bacterium]